jgi:hypothetical protein
MAERPRGSTSLTRYFTDPEMKADMLRREQAARKRVLRELVDLWAKYEAMPGGGFFGDVTLSENLARKHAVLQRSLIMRMIAITRERIERQAFDWREDMVRIRALDREIGDLLAPLTAQALTTDMVRLPAARACRRHGVDQDTRARKQEQIQRALEQLKKTHPRRKNTWYSKELAKKAPSGWPESARRIRDYFKK